MFTDFFLFRIQITVIYRNRRIESNLRTENQKVCRSGMSQRSSATGCKRAARTAYVRAWLLPDRSAGDGQPAAKAAGPRAATRSRARSDEDAVAVQSRRQHHARRPETTRPEPDRDDTAGQVPARQRATVAAVRVDHVHV